MYPTSQCVWYRYPGSPFYIFANSVSYPRLFVLPSYHNPSDQNTLPLQRVIIDEVESVEEVCSKGDVQLHETFINVKKTERAISTSDELISYEGEKATGNGDFDTLLYSPVSICSSLSDRTEQAAENLDRVGREFRGTICADASCGVENAKVGAGCIEDRAFVGGVTEDEYPADLQLKVIDKIGHAPQLMDFGSCSSVEIIQAKPTVGKSLRVLKKAKVGRDNVLDGWPKKKWMKRWMSQNKRSC